MESKSIGIRLFRPLNASQRCMGFLQRAAAKDLNREESFDGEDYFIVKFKMG